MPPLKKFSRQNSCLSALISDGMNRISERCPTGKRVSGAFCVVIVAVFLAAWATLPGSAAAEVKLGILPRLDPVQLYTMFSPLAAYLSAETGEKVSIVIPRDFESFQRAVRNGQLHLGFSNSIVYIKLKKDMPIRPLGVAVEHKAGARFRGAVIVRKDSGIRTLQDLRGKKLVFVDKDSAAGYIFPMLLLHRAGLDVHKDFEVLPFAKKHDNVASAVFHGAADAGGIREDDLGKMESSIDLTRIRIVAYTDYYPNWPLFAAPVLDPAVGARIKTALLKLKNRSALAQKVLAPADILGFEPAADADYEKLRSAARMAGVL